MAFDSSAFLQLCLCSIGDFVSLVDLSITKPILANVVGSLNFSHADTLPHQKMVQYARSALDPSESESSSCGTHLTHLEYSFTLKSHVDCLVNPVDKLMWKSASNEALKNSELALIEEMKTWKKNKGKAMSKNTKLDSSIRKAISKAIQASKKLQAPLSFDIASAALELSTGRHLIR